MDRFRMFLASLGFCIAIGCSLTAPPTPAQKTCCEPSREHVSARLTCDCVKCPCADCDGLCALRVLP